MTSHTDQKNFTVWACNSHLDTRRVFAYLKSNKGTNMIHNQTIGTLKFEQGKHMQIWQINRRQIAEELSYREDI
jgi:hypothetical protein